jgi:hypothetical protein
MGAVDYPEISESEKTLPAKHISRPLTSGHRCDEFVEPAFTMVLLF